MAFALPSLIPPNTLGTDGTALFPKPQTPAGSSFATPPDPLAAFRGTLPGDA